MVATQSARCDPARLVLGTAQLGAPYGVANRTGKPDPGLAREIVAAAWSGGIRCFDTAQAYGESESVLGTALRENGISNAEVVTKLHPDLNYRDPKALELALDGSGHRLEGQRIQCLMLHREELLAEWDSGLGTVLRRFVREGRCASVGASVYSPAMGRAALEREGLTNLQAPANVLDRRFERAGIFDQADELNKQVHVRSIYLQGLVLLAPDQVPAHLDYAWPHVAKFRQLAQDWGVPPMQAALGYIRDEFPRARILVGVETPEQVESNLAMWAEKLPDDLHQILRESFEQTPLEVVRPDLWHEPKWLAEGDRLRLRPMRVADASGPYQRWMNDPEVTRYLESRFVSHSADDLRDYILRNTGEGRGAFLAIVEKRGHRHVGNIRISQPHEMYGTTDMGIIVGERDCWGKGYATEAIGLALNHAFLAMGARKVIAGVYESNKGSIRAFEKNGFVQEAKLRKQAELDSEYEDVLQYGILVGEWKDGRE